MGSTSPTARAIAEMRRLGWMAQVVEKWNPHAKVRQDLFGIIDVLAVDERYCYGIQVTSGSNHAARRTKMSLSTKALVWLRSPHRRLEIWSYSKKKIKRGGVAFKYELRRERLTVESLASDPGAPQGMESEG